MPRVFVDVNTLSLFSDYYVLILYCDPYVKKKSKK